MPLGAGETACVKEVVDRDIGMGHVDIYLRADAAKLEGRRRMRRIAPSVLLVIALATSACDDPEAAYRAELAACTVETNCGPEQVPMLTRTAKAEELAKMGGRATLDDIGGHPGDDPVALQEVKESFVAYYNMPFGAEGEREAWIRFMRAMDRASELRQSGTASPLEASSAEDKARLDEATRNQAEIERRIAEETARRSSAGL